MTTKKILGIISLLFGIPGFIFNLLEYLKYDNLHDVLIQTGKILESEINSTIMDFALMTIASIFLSAIGIYLLKTHEH